MQWEKPEQSGFDPEQMEEARKKADTVQSAAVMVVHRGHVVAAWGDIARKLELHSVRKNLYSALYGIAVEKHLIDLNATLSDLGVDDLQSLTAEEKRARIEDVTEVLEPGRSRWPALTVRMSTRDLATGRPHA
jgi:CubicO group peptidase (beta-lactamase class C family)